jgi:hypothetical protein
MLLNSSGNVGIGTTNPTATLHLRAASPYIYLDDTSTNGTLKRFKFVAGDVGPTQTMTFGFETIESTNSISIMSLSEIGNVGIGTLSPVAKLHVQGGNATFGTPGAGSNTNGRFFSIEGNTDSSGEGSARIFFTEHNSSTAQMDNYGMSLGYRGGNTFLSGSSGNVWNGLALIDNGQWGMWGHNNDISGSVIMYGDREATFINFNGNNLNNVGSAYFTGNVGIGTTSPVSKLTIESSTYDDFIKLTRTGVGSMGISVTNPRGIQTTDAAGNLTTAISYSVTYTYAAGTTILKNNIGQDDVTNQVTAGTVNSNTVTITPASYKDWGMTTNSSANITDADIIATVGGNIEWATSKLKGSFTITGPGGAGPVKYAFYAVPAATSGTITSIVAGGFESIAAFDKVTRNFTNAQGHVVSYDIYVQKNSGTDNVTLIIQ